MMKVTCACGKMYQVATERAGQTLPCPACGRPIAIPSPVQFETSTVPYAGGPASVPGYSRHQVSVQHRSIWPRILLVVGGIAGLFVVAVLTGFILAALRSSSTKGGSMSSGVVIDPPPGDNPWSATSDPEPGGPFNYPTGQVSLTAKGRYLADFLPTSGAAGKAVVKYWVGRTINVDTVDLRSGERTEQLSLSANESMGLPVSASPDGSMLATWASSARHKLQLWSLAKKSKVAEFDPYQSAGENKPELTGCEWVDAQHLLTTSSQGEIILWKIPGLGRVYTIRRQEPIYSSPHLNVALSPGRKFLAVFGRNELTLYEAATGKGCGRLTVAGAESSNRISFRPDGRELVAILMVSGQQTIVRWDVQTGKTIDSFPSPLGARVTKNEFYNSQYPIPDRDKYWVAKNYMHSLSWWGNRYLLLEQAYILDIDRHLLVARYEGTIAGKPWESPLDQRLWMKVLDTKANSEYLVAVPAPMDQLEPLVKDVSGPAENFWLKPGMSVELKLEIEGPTTQGELYKKLLAAEITQRLQAQGIGVSSGAVQRLVVRSRWEETEEVVVSPNVQDRMQGKTINVKGKTLIGQFVLQSAEGQDHWQRETIFKPFYQTQQDIQNSLSPEHLDRRWQTFILYLPETVPSLVPRDSKKQSLPALLRWTASGTRLEDASRVEH